ncbi:aldo/keto reductase [Pseudonocardiaceae bacterium YIM PH 21723]|nr:aldo/keto reductase [Pseudonocardiaceae bacterium YIM PH 21723]
MPVPGCSLPYPRPADAAGFPADSALWREDTVTTLDTYRLLGRSGLRVSPMALGAMTFGTDWGWGSDAEESRRVFDTYVGAGGNFIDTASMYTNGSSEKLLGEFIGDRRDELVIATKYSQSLRPTDPNAGGNNRKTMIASVERSLRQLRTDYIDLFYLHYWDFTTPVQEVLRGMDDLVRAGKVRYLGISDIPAWEVSRMQTIAELRGWSPLIAMQVVYNLIERDVEREFIPMAREMGLGIVPFSPLAYGVLAGKYTRADLGSTTSADVAGTRKNVAAANGALTERGLDIADAVRRVAAEIGATPAQVALAWTLTNPGVTSPIIGARTTDQLTDNLGALDVRLDAGQLRTLAEASAIEPGFPHNFLVNEMANRTIYGQVSIEGITVQGSRAKALTTP